MSLYGLIFLGNPGREYEKTRHNIAWRVCREICRGAPGGEPSWSGKFKGETALLLRGSQKWHLLKPQTFMNLSGESAVAMAAFYKIQVDHLVAVHDDLELPFGEVKFQRGGGLGGHRGLKSLTSSLGSPDFHRLRLGVGRPARGDVSSFVLGAFTPDEEIELTRIIPAAVRAWEEAVAAWNG